MLITFKEFKDKNIFVNIAKKILTIVQSNQKRIVDDKIKKFEKDCKTYIEKGKIFKIAVYERKYNNVRHIEIQIVIKAGNNRNLCKMRTQIKMNNKILNEILEILNFEDNNTTSKVEKKNNQKLGETPIYYLTTSTNKKYGFQIKFQYDNFENHRPIIEAYADNIDRNLVIKRFAYSLVNSFARMLNMSDSDTLKLILFSLEVHINPGEQIKYLFLKYPYKFSDNQKYTYQEFMIYIYIPSIILSIAERIDKNYITGKMDRTLNKLEALFIKKWNGKEKKDKVGKLILERDKMNLINILTWIRVRLLNDIIDYLNKSENGKDYEIDKTIKSNIEKIMMLEDTINRILKYLHTYMFKYTKYILNG